MVYKYRPAGVCSQQITIDIDENTQIINDIKFTGGCHGNLQGIAALSKGKTIDEVASALKGIDCRMRGTSCPDQLARALEEIKENI